LRELRRLDDSDRYYGSRMPTRLRERGHDLPAAPDAERPPAPVLEARRRVRGPVPTRVKAAALLAVASAVLAGVEGASRLPSLLAGSDASAIGARSALGPGRLDTGTAASVTAGPFFPVAGAHDFGGPDARFGAWHSGHRHEGQDVLAKAGTPLVAVRTGVVVDEASAESAYSGGRGNFIAIYSEFDDRTYVYFHMRHRSQLREGDFVRAGDPVGEVGCTGSCWGNHLHFEIRLGRGTEAKPIDPLPLLRDWPPAPGEG
jgi:murein DD-endopeptidase MepM/ murein hydrolase activator NlpD